VFLGVVAAEPDDALVFSGVVAAELDVRRVLVRFDFASQRLSMASHLRRWLCFALFTVGSAICSADYAQAQPATTSESIAATVVQPYVEAHQVAGAVMLVADKEKVLSVETAGYADIEAKKPMRADSLFWIASQSKSITAAALLILVDEGKVNLDDPLEKYLPEMKSLRVKIEETPERTVLARPKHPVTVRQALSHTAGMPFKSEVETPYLDGLPLATAVRSYAITPLVYEPGSKYQYSNAGINTAGRIIEVVSGMPYEDFVARRLLEPLGMKDTTFWPDAAQTARLANSYKANAAKDNLEATPIGQLRYPLDDHNRRFPMPAGGYFSTADDVGRFCRMLLNEGTLEGKRILSAEAVGELSKKQTGEAVNQNYGLGFAVTPEGAFGHGGAHATNMNVDPKRGIVTVWLVQHAGFVGDGGKAQGAWRAAVEKRYGKGP
jgi:CubicO group peptidase (beta-lactamase class C family)